MGTFLAAIARTRDQPGFTYDHTSQATHTHGFSISINFILGDLSTTVFNRLGPDDRSDQFLLLITVYIATKKSWQLFAEIVTIATGSGGGGPLP